MRDCAMAAGPAFVGWRAVKFARPGLLVWFRRRSWLVRPRVARSPTHGPRGDTIPRPGSGFAEPWCGVGACFCKAMGPFPQNLGSGSGRPGSRISFMGSMFSRPGCHFGRVFGAFMVPGFRSRRLRPARKLARPPCRVRGCRRAPARATVMAGGTLGRPPAPLYERGPGTWHGRLGGWERGQCARAAREPVRPRTCFGFCALWMDVLPAHRAVGPHGMGCRRCGPRGHKLASTCGKMRPSAKRRAGLVRYAKRARPLRAVFRAPRRSLSVRQGCLFFRGAVWAVWWPYCGQVAFGLDG